MANISKKNAISLVFFSLGSSFLSYATIIIFARAMSINEYDDYAVAISTIAIMATLAEMSTGKYALRIMPSYRENRKWALAKGYLRYSIILIFLVSTILMFITLYFDYKDDGIFGANTLGIAILFLPVIAWVGAGSEFITANLAVIRSAFVTRLLVPGLTFMLGIFWVLSPYEFTASQGVLFYGIGWLVGLFVVVLFLRQTTQPEIRKAPAEYRSREWITKSLPFIFFALLITVLAKVGVIVLQIVHPQEAMVAVYAVAMETGALIYLIAKSTDKMFLPDVSLMIERQDFAGLRSGRNRRWRYLGSVCAVYLLIIFFFGREILLIFGPEFESGYPALCIIAVATSVWTMASLSPSYLKYIGKARFVIVATAIAVISHIGLCFPLGYYLGATGAALSYAIPVILLYSIMAILTGHHLRKEMKG